MEYCEYEGARAAGLPRFHRWLKWMKKKMMKKRVAEPSQTHLSVVLDDGGDQDNRDMVSSSDDSFARSMDISSCIRTNEFRVFVGTWNVAGRSPGESLVVDLDDWLNLKEAPDIYVIGFQEIVPLKARTVLGAEDATVATKWNSLIGRTLNRKYKVMGSKKMVGIFVSVWVKEELRRKYQISDVIVCTVACGIMGWLGNKGSVAVSFSMEGTSFCFVAAHLASGEKRGDEMRRNHQVLEIFRRTSFPLPRVSHDDAHYNPRPLSILGHDRIFWFGDLNYRLNMEGSVAKQLIRKGEWRALQEFDQLRMEQAYGGVFQGWREGHIDFAPTYKLLTKYSSSISADGFPPRSTTKSCRSQPYPPLPPEKQRTPAWCDRILWHGKDVKQLSYLRTESKFSDHSPVSALFSTHIEFLNTLEADTKPPPPTRTLSLMG
ncbi:type I inositol polyphosphate 5-phosphatase 4-like [Macadamia integrifolia]|uniref:type I inositol polyphosphate 5-phosphatase 4-like n=1 Tax=Macadamia integrifolia TaxID=60698 RepID=UPI001C4E6148|nr:type I inositol polyphosphate 5-phosphatase 4-like [Macadamia integrifolia]